MGVRVLPSGPNIVKGVDMKINEKKLKAYFVISADTQATHGPFMTRQDARDFKLDGEKIVQLTPQGVKQVR